MNIEEGKTYVAVHRSKIYAEGDKLTVNRIFDPDKDGRIIIAVTFDNSECYSDTIERFEPDFLREVKDELQPVEYPPRTKLTSNRLFTIDEPKPAHYDTGIDTIAFMRANCPPEQVEGFLRGNALKYLQRYPSKGTPVEDLKKARHYIEMLIEEVEGR